MVTGYIGVHPGFLEVNSGSLGSLGYAVGVVEFIYCGASWG